MVRSTGRFGFSEIFQNSKDQREFERESSANPQSKPVAQPYARLNLDFFSPIDFGPSILGFRPLASWRATFLASWQRGYAVTWAGGGSNPNINNNLRWVDSHNVDLRLTRTVRAFDTDLNFFVDISNVLNTRYLTQNGFVDGNDLGDYYRSLHLPANKLEPLRGAYLAPPGKDQPGDFRKENIAFQPIVAVVNIFNLQSPHERPLYYNELDKRYYQFRNGNWVDADPDFVKQVLDDKAYIDMPNLSSFAFFNPRNVIFGIRITF